MRIFYFTMQACFLFRLRCNNAVCLIYDDHKQDSFILYEGEKRESTWILQFKNKQVKPFFELLDGQVHISDRDGNVLKMSYNSTHVLNTYAFPEKDEGQVLLERISVEMKLYDPTKALLTLNELQALLLKKLRPSINA